MLMPMIRICASPVRVLWFGTNSCEKPSCMEPYFARNIARNPLEAIRAHRQHHDYAKHTDLNKDSHHLQMSRCNEYSMEPARRERELIFKCVKFSWKKCTAKCSDRYHLPPTRRGIVLLDMCHSYIHGEFYSQVCMATMGFYLEERQHLNHRWSQNPRWPYTVYFDRALEMVRAFRWFRSLKRLKSVEESLSCQSSHPPTPRSLYPAIPAASLSFRRLSHCPSTRDFEFEDNCCEWWKHVNWKSTMSAIFEIFSEIAL